MLVRLRPVFFSLPNHGLPSVKFRSLENFTLYLRNSLSLNLRAIENCICGLRSIGRKMRSILQTVWSQELWSPLRGGAPPGSSDRGLRGTEEKKKKRSQCYPRGASSLSSCVPYLLHHHAFCGRGWPPRDIKATRVALIPCMGQPLCLDPLAGQSRTVAVDIRTSSS
jgi:hypothetical protein